LSSTIKNRPICFWRFKYFTFSVVTPTPTPFSCLQLLYTLLLKVLVEFSKSDPVPMTESVVFYARHCLGIDINTPPLFKHQTSAIGYVISTRVSFTYMHVEISTRYLYNDTNYKGRRMLCIPFATLYDASNFYCMSLLYIMGKNIINNKNNFHNFIISSNT
jgi:hypothetical protein